MWTEIPQINSNGQTVFIDFNRIEEKSDSYVYWWMMTSSTKTSEKIYIQTDCDSDRINSLQGDLYSKPIGFGEGGLAIIRKEVAPFAREAINFGWVDGAFNERGSNFKMSELSAAGILQYWDSFDIDEMSKEYRDNYFGLTYKLASKYGGVSHPNRGDEDAFFPSNLPFIFNEPSAPERIKADVEVKKYYKPLDDLPVSSDLYNKTLNFPIHMSYEI